MLFLYLFIGHVLAMDENCLNLSENPINSAKILPLSAENDKFFIAQHDTLLTEINTYKDQLKIGMSPFYSDFFMKKIDELINKNPDFIKLIYGEIKKENFSNSFGESVAKKRKESPQKLRLIVKDCMEEIQDSLASPVKVGSNTYHFPKEGLLPQGTPRRKRNIQHLFRDNKMPTYIIDGKIVVFELHHLLQQNQNENILLLSKEAHKKYSGALHTPGKKSEIDRTAFAKEKKMAAQLYFLKKIEQALIILRNENIKIKAMNNLKQTLEGTSYPIASAVGEKKSADISVGSAEKVARILDFS